MTAHQIKQVRRGMSGLRLVALLIVIFVSVALVLTHGHLLDLAASGLGVGVGFLLSLTPKTPTG